jgi:hypothetical protein
MGDAPRRAARHPRVRHRMERGAAIGLVAGDSPHRSAPSLCPRRACAGRRSHGRRILRAGAPALPHLALATAAPATTAGSTSCPTRSPVSPGVARSRWRHAGSTR